MSLLCPRSRPGQKEAHSPALPSWWKSNYSIGKHDNYTGRPTTGRQGGTPTADGNLIQNWSLLARGSFFCPTQMNMYSCFCDPIILHICYNHTERS